MMPQAFAGRRYKLRPEVAESIYYLWYFTGEPVWQHMAKDILMAIETKAKAKYGYAEVVDVDSGVIRRADKMESYFFAETLLYLYLTFSPKDTLDLDMFVFNTEAHPLKISAFRR